MKELEKLFLLPKKDSLVYRFVVGSSDDIINGNIEKIRKFYEVFGGNSLKAALVTGIYSLPDAEYIRYLRLVHIFILAKIAEPWEIHIHSDRLSVGIMNECREGDNAVFCPKCGYKSDGTAPAQQTVYVVQKQQKIDKKDYILKPAEKVFVILIGVLTIVTGVISFFTSILGDGQVYNSIGGVYFVILGIFVLMKHRWALIMLDIGYLLAALITLAAMFAAFSHRLTTIAFLYILLLAYVIAIMVFIHIAQKAVNPKEQLKRAGL